VPDVITSTTNETIKAVARLKRSRERRRTGSILVEGPNAFNEALDAGFEPSLALVEEGDVESRARMSAHPSATVLLVTQDVLDAAADTPHPRSPVMVMPRPPAGVIRPRDTVVLVDISDPGNAGTIVRTAAALGWDVAHTPGCVDLWSPKTLRSAAGAHFRSNLVPIDLNRDIAHLSAHTVVASLVSGGSPTVDQAGPYALYVGNEPRGLDAAVIETASHLLTIQMVSKAESLNVSAAAAIAMYLLASPSPG
jgi:TrmH family RNA methyltransferase